MHALKLVAGVGLLISLAGPAIAAEALFKFKGKSYSEKDLDPKNQARLFEAETSYHNLRTRILDEAMLDMYFAEQAKKGGKSAEQLKKDKLKVAEPSEKELKAAFEENKARIPYPYEQVKSQLVHYVKERKENDAMNKLIAEVKKQGGYQLLLAAPQAPVMQIATEGFATRGKADAKVSVVEFADYKCGHCKEASKAFSKVYDKFDKKVKFVFIDFPVITGSEKIAEGGACALNQNKFWEYNKLAFEQQGVSDKPEEFAKKLKLDEGKFKECMDKGQGKALVEKGKKEADRLGLTGTPSIFINGRRVIISSFTPEVLSKEIDAALKQTGAS